ncbi:hypothetical protein [Sulfuricurvum sp.]|uniref:hypothetical protein n=1 Tax=Sulfuricurvum sp. TaxID=2025608 RepID=UPI003BB031D8
MKILLFNDNPVVRKLVSLSAQKTKDDLSIISSVNEIEESRYDLLVIDDALYSDEVFETLKELAVFRGTLLMATRGKAVPAGFENVINKPFLPTDLVDMLIHIERKLAASPETVQSVTAQERPAQDELADGKSLEETLPGLEEENSDMDAFDLSGDLNIYGEDRFEDFEEVLIPTAILDKEEVQEVQNLLDDTESDGENSEDEIIIKGFNDLEGMDELSELDEFEEHDLPNEAISENTAVDDLLLETNGFDFSDDDLNLLADDTDEEMKENFSNELLLDEEAFGEIETLAESKAEEGFGASDEDLELLSEEGEFDEEAFGDIEALPESKDEEDFGTIDEELSFSSEEDELDEEATLPSMEKNSLLEDNELDDLESQIQDAVSGLEAETLDEELEFDTLGLDFDESLMEELNMDEGSGVEAGEGFDELDMLDERQLKLAIGEEVEDEEIDLHVGEGDTSLSAEALDEVMEESASYEALEEELGDLDEIEASTHAEGVEALQALLKALSNEDVAKSLKGLNISININFGNGA